MPVELACRTASNRRSGAQTANPLSAALAKAAFSSDPPYLLSSRINIVGPLRKRVASTSARINSVVLGEEIREWFVGMSGCARRRFDIQVSDRQDHPNAR